MSQPPPRDPAKTHRRCPLHHIEWQPAAGLSPPSMRYHRLAKEAEGIVSRFLQPPLATWRSPRERYGECRRTEQSKIAVELVL